jgi:hypothetical protein
MAAMYARRLRTASPTAAAMPTNVHRPRLSQLKSGASRKITSSRSNAAGTAARRTVHRSMRATNV